MIDAHHMIPSPLSSNIRTIINPRLLKPNAVDRQRQNYRYLQGGQHSHLNEHRIAALERIGFVWSFYDLRWEIGYAELVTYKNEFGNL